MSVPPSNFYARCRERCGTPAILRDEGGIPSERLLQAIWQHQRLRRDQLRTLDGQPVQVLHPGFGGAGGGPDFRDALIQLGDAMLQRGDVEVDVRAGGWHAHGHDRNPSFRNVILHVVWEADRTGGLRSSAVAVRRHGVVEPKPLNPPPPVLCIGDVLDAPLGELSLWLGGEAAQAWPENLRGQCSERLRGLAADRLTALLHEAAAVRLQSKAVQFQARARVVGWEQALWEGLFRGLGYRHNTWPMHWLAERRVRWSEGEPPVLELQARLLGLSGLLPAELKRTDAAADRYVRRVWDHWWRERESFADCTLPRTAWHPQGLRPANHPQRRLALAAHWIADGTLVSQLEDWCARDLKPAELVPSVLKILQVDTDGFWSWHWTFRSARLARPQPLLGATRATDLAVNAVLPWLWMRAVEGGSDTLRSALETRYFAWPPAEDNAVLRLARKRLLGDGFARGLRGAAMQQGLLQIVRDFCDRTNAVCSDCRFPIVVDEWCPPPIKSSKENKVTESE